MTPAFLPSLEQLDPFDHAFVDALLHLRGIHEPPTGEEFAEAHAQLMGYYAAIELAPASSTAIDDEWLDGQSIEAVAAQLAYLFTRFGILYRSQATPMQQLAFQRWWMTGEDAVGYAACTTCAM